MPAARGSKHKLLLIPEVTFGVTPATPTMLEIPVNSFNKDVAVGLIRSGQIRTHPFVDRLMKGVQTNDLEIVTELQDDTHDSLLELLCGSTFSSNTVVMTDALRGASIESGHTAVNLYDVFTGSCVTRGEFSFNAQPDAVVTATYGLMAKGGTLDNALTAATAVTAAPENDPFVFHEASVTIAGVSRPVTAMSMTVQRTIDPLYVLGTPIPREYIPSEVTVTGSITIPLEDNTESTRLIGFTAAALVAACVKGSASRTFNLPKINYASMGRKIQGRGVILQEINYEAKYDSGIASVLSIARSA